jgi:hypothetical protein
MWKRGADVFKKVCDEMDAWGTANGVKDIKELIGAIHR